jgi:hypothetical protein
MHGTICYTNKSCEKIHGFKGYLTKGSNGPQYMDEIHFLLIWLAPKEVKA